MNLLLSMTALAIQVFDYVPTLKVAARFILKRTAADAAKALNLSPEFSREAVA